MYRMVCRVCGISAILSVASASALAAGIGVVVDVVNEGYRTPPGASELIARPTDEVVEGEGLRTGVESAIHVQFVDGSELSVEAESEILLSDYVFEPASGVDGEIQLTEGLFHFDSNGAEDSGIELHTPVATIGIRGTEFLVTVAKDATIVDILEGEVEVQARGGGRSARCVGGQSALVAAQDADAICGDLGSFSTAAGAPPSPPAIAGGEARGAAGRPDAPAARDRPTKGPDNDPPDNDPPAAGGGNHSGHDDGSNPGRGGGKGHDKDNGGADNPGGSK